MCGVAMMLSKDRNGWSFGKGSRSLRYLLSEADPPWRPAPLPTRWRFQASCSGSNAEGMADSRDFAADIAQPDDAEHLAVELRADCGLPAAISDGAGFLNEVTRATEDERPG